jgi:hypothetical protein
MKTNSQKVRIILFIALAIIYASLSIDDFCAGGHIIRAIILAVTSALNIAVAYRRIKLS